MDYKSLKSIYYQNRTNYEQEYQNRINSYGAIKTTLHPYLMKKQDFATNNYPLFILSLLDIQLLSQKIVEHSKEIEKLAGLLPSVAQQQFYLEQLFNAIISTNEIEGISTTRKDVAVAISAIKNQKKKEVKHQSTVRMYLDIMEDNFLHITKLDHIREIYDKLTKGEIANDDKLDGVRFRADSVTLMNNKSGKIEHIAPSNEEKINQMLEDWLLFINNPQYPFLIKASLAHYFFENIHPFYDGNGRTGRYILSKYLSRKLDKFSGLIISKKINDDKAKYYKAFSDTGNFLNRADATRFVHTMLTFVIKGQNEIIETLSEKKQMLDYYFKKIEQKSLETVQQEILFLLVQSQLFISDVEASLSDLDILKILLHTEFSQRSIKQAIKDLEENGYLTKIFKRPVKHAIVDSFFDYQ